MSAILVLILRILMVLSIYGFLGLALLALWREIKITTDRQTTIAHPIISVEIEGESKQRFAQPEILIGRDAENDIQLIEDTVSQFHARIFYLNENWMVEDSQSTNGTYLNGEIIHAPTVLIADDRIDIGSKTLLINNSGKPSSA